VRWQLIAAAVTLLALLLSRRKVRARPLLGQKVIVCLLLFLLWLGIQSIWVLDWEMHRDLLVMYARFIIIVALIYACMDSHKHLQLFLWTHVLGCFYLGWIVYSTYEGGRFEAFGGE
jgi:hypothetical protein